ncbi:MAG: CoA transferase, partial [Sphingomonadaceae bacterium]
LVLSMAEAPDHPHNRARQTFGEVGGMVQPMPAPRYSVTQTDRPQAAPPAGAHTDEVLESLGMAPGQIAGLRAVGAVG